MLYFINVSVKYRLLLLLLVILFGKFKLLFKFPGILLLLLVGGFELIDEVEEEEFKRLTVFVVVVGFILTGPIEDR